jgi:hypothetical protein
VIRGGSWDKVPQYARSAFCSRRTPDLRYGNLGFRLARVQSGRCAQASECLQRWVRGGSVGGAAEPRATPLHEFFVSSKERS